MNRQESLAVIFILLVSAVAGYHAIQKQSSQDQVAEEVIESYRHDIVDQRADVESAEIVNITDSRYQDLYLMYIRTSFKESGSEIFKLYASKDSRYVFEPRKLDQEHSTGHSHGGEGHTH